MPPAHDYEAFVAVCASTPAGVIVLSGAEASGRTVFGLKKKSELIAFIGNNGLERLKFINSRTWERNPTLVVDAYEFYSDATPGYISISYSSERNIWFIKSFKRNTQPSDIQNRPFADALRHLLPK